MNTKLRVCLIYDRFYPNDIGGAERWMRCLAEELASKGHEVTYLTQRHGNPNPAELEVPFSVVSTRGTYAVYRRGRRRLWPAIAFGLFCARHLVRHGGRYDVVHTAAFPFFPLLAASLLGPVRKYPLIVEWHDVWPLKYWRSYSGRVAGTLAWLLQRACIRASKQAFCMSRMNAERLLAEGLKTSAVVLPGLYDGPIQVSPRPKEPLILFAGRLIPEKRVIALLAAYERVQQERPQLRCSIFGDGPERRALEEFASRRRLAVTFHGAAPREQLVDELGRATCFVSPSSREGYGLVIVEAAAHGTPSIIVAGPDNAAVELIEEGKNGFVTQTPSAEELAQAILRAYERRQELALSTASWFRENEHRLLLSTSIEVVLKHYRMLGHDPNGS
jgi:glycosyltransferase involved in cell wall biosynthesis